jgi:outer membrane protein assembly factor BamB
MHNLNPLRRSLLFVAVITGITASGPASTKAGDWPRFRGPNGSGVAADEAPTPVTWSPTENLKWSTALPGEGVSCPIVVGERVFVTTYSGYGFEDGDLLDLKRHLVCINRIDGQILWQKSVEAVLPEDSFTGMGVPAHGYASHTPVSDGKRVFVFFGKSGVLAYDMDGKSLWRTSVGSDSDPKRWGSSSSPILVGNIVVVTAGPERRAILGLDAETGKEVWSAPAEGLGNVWGTPATAVLSPDRTDLVIGAPEEIWGLNPQTGKVRWYCAAIESDSFNTSVVVQGETVYAVEGRGGGAIAVRAGGKGDVTSTHVNWTGRDANRFCTPVVYRDRLYFVSNGVLNSLDAKSGKKIFQARLTGGSDRAVVEEPVGRGGGGRGNADYASPVAADGKLYYVNARGDMHVFAAEDEYRSLAVNRVSDGGEVFAATPAISSGELFFRSNKRLYCISTTATAAR